MVRLLSTLFVAVLLTIPAAGQHPQSTLDKIKATKTISLGYVNLPSFSYVGEDKKPTGYSVGLCTRIAAGVQQQLGLGDLTIKWVVVTEIALPWLPMARLTWNVARPPTPLRQEQVDFSSMTFVDGGSILVSSTANINRLSDIAGKRIAVVPAPPPRR
jgi:ABC-type amino acid transport substrate-binding protein